MALDYDEDAKSLAFEFFKGQKKKRSYGPDESEQNSKGEYRNPYKDSISSSASFEKN